MVAVGDTKDTECWPGVFEVVVVIQPISMNKSVIQTQKCAQLYRREAKLAEIKDGFKILKTHSTSWNSLCSFYRLYR